MASSSSPQRRYAPRSRISLPTKILRRPELPPCPSDVEPQPLGLSEAIQLAARQNLGIELKRQQAAVARAGIGVARGRFEPSLTAFYGHSNADTPPPVTLLQQGVVSSQLNVDSDLWNVGLSTQLPTGTQLSVGWTNLRTLSTAQRCRADRPARSTTPGCRSASRSRCSGASRSTSTSRGPISCGRGSPRDGRRSTCAPR